jgi:hypothetical protein
MAHSYLRTLIPVLALVQPACMGKQVAYLKKMVLRNNDLAVWQKFSNKDCKESRQYFSAMCQHDYRGRLTGAVLHLFKF